MLEEPAEAAIKKHLVEDAWATHELKVFWATGEQLGGEVPKNAQVLVTVKKKVNKEVLDKFPALRLVAVAFTGYDHVDLDACRERGISVANVPGYSTDGVAELVFGLIFSLLRQIPTAHQHVRAGKWNWPPGNELSGKRLGLIGTGKIGQRIAEIGKAFRCAKIMGYDTHPDPKFTQMGGEYVKSLATLFLHADVLVVACALTKETKGLVSEKLLELLRPESILINCARGAIIDQEALTEMLSEGRFRAGLDVYEVEPLAADHPLRSVKEDHLVTVPHLAYKCMESLIRRQDVTLANILAFLSDNPQNIVS
jgi:D-3-phosphoglycerate dehydrogenase